MLDRLEYDRFPASTIEPGCWVLSLSDFLLQNMYERHALERATVFKAAAEEEAALQHERMREEDALDTAQLDEVCQIESGEAFYCCVE